MDKQLEMLLLPYLAIHNTHPAACDPLDAPPSDESSGEFFITSNSNQLNLLNFFSSVSNLEAPGVTAQVESATDASLAIVQHIPSATQPVPLPISSNTCMIFGKTLSRRDKLTNHMNKFHAKVDNTESVLFFLIFNFLGCDACSRSACPSNF